MIKRARLEIFTEPLLYRDVLSIITNYCDIQTWGRLKQCCKLFNFILVRPPISIPESFIPLLRRLLYHLDKNLQSFNIFKYLNILEKASMLLYYINIDDLIFYSEGSITYISGRIFGNIYNEPVEMIIQRYIKYKDNNW
jgi:hypothetical protein